MAAYIYLATLVVANTVSLSDEQMLDGFKVAP